MGDRLVTVPANSTVTIAWVKAEVVADDATESTVAAYVTPWTPLPYALERKACLRYYQALESWLATAYRQSGLDTYYWLAISEMRKGPQVRGGITVVKRSDSSTLATISIGDGAQIAYSSSHDIGLLTWMHLDSYMTNSYSGNTQLALILDAEIYD